jgi:hypothetical protein
MVRDMCWDLEECTVCDYHDPVCELDVDVRLPVMLWVSHHVPLG